MREKFPRPVECRHSNRFLSPIYGFVCLYNEMIKRIGSLLLCMAAIPALAQTQNGKLSFEVTSVKPNNSNSGNSTTNLVQNRFVATNVTVRQLVNTAYRVQNFQVIGGVSWMDSDRFDIEAKPEAGAIP